LPVSLLSRTQRESYGRYPDSLLADELARYFHLDDDDNKWITTKGRDSNRLFMRCNCRRRASEYGCALDAVRFSSRIYSLKEWML